MRASALLIAILASLAVGLLIAPAPFGAESQDTARRAVEQGELVPLSRILANVEAEFPGRIIEVELERKRGRFVYEIEVLQADGRVLELLYDGRTGERLAARIDDD